MKTIKTKPIIFLFMFLIVLMTSDLTFAFQGPLKIDEGGSVPINSLWSTNSNGVFLHANAETLVLNNFRTGEIKYFPKKEPGVFTLSPQWIYINHCLGSGNSLSKYTLNMDSVYADLYLFGENYANFVHKNHRLYRKGDSDLYSIEIYNELTQTISHIKSNTSGIDEREQVDQNALYSVLKDGIYKTDVDAILPKARRIMPIQAFTGNYTVYKNTIYFEEDGIFKYDIQTKKKERISEISPLAMAVFSDHLYVIDQKNMNFYQIAPDKSLKKIANLGDIINSKSKDIAIVKGSNSSLVIIDLNTRIEVELNDNNPKLNHFNYHADMVENNIGSPERVVIEPNYTYFVDNGTYKVDTNRLELSKLNDWSNDSIIKYQNHIYFDGGVKYDSSNLNAENSTLKKVSMDFKEATIAEKWWVTWSHGPYKLFKISNDQYYFLSEKRRDHIITLKKENGKPLAPNEIGESEVEMILGLESAIEIDKTTIYTTENNKIITYDLKGGSKKLLYTAESSLNGLYLYKGDLYFSGKGLYKLNLETNKVVKLTHDWVQHFTVMEDHIIYAPLYFKGKHYTYKMKLDGSDLYKVETPMGPDRENTFAIFTPKAVFFIDKVTNTVEKIKWLKN